jgi:hypothetical protein
VKSLVLLESSATRLALYIPHFYCTRRAICPNVYYANLSLSFLTPHDVAAKIESGWKRDFNDFEQKILLDFYDLFCKKSAIVVNIRARIIYSPSSPSQNIMSLD